MAPGPQGPPETPDAPRPVSRSALVDALLGAIAALPVIAVLIGSGDLFVAVAALLPVAVMAVCSLDPPDIAQLAARLRDQRRR